MKPDFIIAGFPKCGSSSLYHYLNQHPNICMSSMKEPHYYSKMPPNYNGFWDNNYGLGRTSVWTPERYSRLYNHCNVNDIKGEASTNTLYLDSYIPEGTKLVIGLRNPVDRAFSNYLDMRRKKRETKSFTKALQLESKRIQLGYSPAWQYSSIGFYTQKLKTVDKVEKLIYFFDDFVKYTNYVLEDITTFLGVSSFNFDTTKVHNQQTKEPASIVLSRFLPGRIQKHFMVEPPKMTAEEKNYLQRLYKIELLELSDYLQRPLPPSWSS